MQFMEKSVGKYMDFFFESLEEFAVEDQELLNDFSKNFSGSPTDIFISSWMNSFRNYS